MKELYRNNYPKPKGRNSTEFAISLTNSLNLCLNVLIVLPIVWNCLSDNIKGRRCYSLDYLIAVRIVCNKSPANVNNFFQK